MTDNVRIIDPSKLVCPVCDHAVRAVMDQKGKRRVVGVHGPRENRCAGSREPGLPWRIACRLPPWEALDDHDKGEALMFVHKVWWEQSFSYARENYSPQFHHRALADLKTQHACRYAVSIVKELGEPLESVPNFWAKFSTPPFNVYPDMVQEPLIDMARRILGDEECQRLMDAAHS